MLHMCAVFHLAVGFKAPALANLITCTEKALADISLRMEAARVLKVQPSTIAALPDEEQVSLLLGMLLSQPNSNGETPLHNAVSMGRVDAVSVLAQKVCAHLGQRRIFTLTTCGLHDCAEQMAAQASQPVAASALCMRMLCEATGLHGMQGHQAVVPQ